MAEIREKMLAADVIGLASPIYFYTMTAQMEAGDIRKTDATEQAYRVGKSLLKHMKNRHPLLNGRAWRFDFVF